jgi:hypothetical protein
MTAPTPSAPTAEMLMKMVDAYAIVAAEDERLGTQTARPLRAALKAHIDRLAALARSEPPAGEPVAISDERIEALWRTEFNMMDFAGFPSPVHRYARAVLAEARAPVAIPEGWKLVPVEPTNAMYDAAVRAYMTWHEAEIDGSKFTHNDVYRAMLAASPLEAQRGMRDCAAAHIVEADASPTERDSRKDAPMTTQPTWPAEMLEYIDGVRKHFGEAARVEADDFLKESLATSKWAGFLSDARGMVPPGWQLVNDATHRLVRVRSTTTEAAQDVYESRDPLIYAFLSALAGPPIEAQAEEQSGND